MVALIDEAVWIGVPVIVLGELEAGFRIGRQHAANHAALEEFLVNPVVDTLPISEDVVALYADIVVELRRAGTPVPANDIWIAAVAARHGAPVVTYDEHFRHIARVGATILRP